MAERETFGGSLAINTPVINDRLALRFSADHRETDGFIENTTLGTDDHDARELQTYRLALRADPTDDTNIVFKVTDASNFGGEDYVDADSFPDKRITDANINEEEGSDIASYNLRFNQVISQHWSFDSETTYFDALYTRIEDSDGAGDIGSLNRDSDVTNFQQEFRVN